MPFGRGEIGQVFQQGCMAMGTVGALTSLTAVIAPLIALPMLMAVSHRPQGDWAIGAPLFFGAALQLTALALAWMHFRDPRHARDAATDTPCTTRS